MNKLRQAALNVINARNLGLIVVHGEEVEAALDKLEIEAADPWRPMDEAPKDGTMFKLREITTTYAHVSEGNQGHGLAGFPIDKETTTEQSWQPLPGDSDE